jgi:outer membrane protein assembly factor BamE (lipoprotein component of BamABCDE complex)
MNRDTISPVKHIILAALALTLLLAGCATDSERPTAAPAEADTGFPLVRPSATTLAELPPPSVKLVDLRKLRVGMTMAEVLEIFPGPVETKISPRDTTVWQYRFAELYFRDGLLFNWFNLEEEY